jgi:hypothetical protein
MSEVDFVMIDCQQATKKLAGSNDNSSELIRLSNAHVQDV